MTEGKYLYIISYNKFNIWDFDPSSRPDVGQGFGFTEAGFHIDALKSVSDWVIFRKRGFDWLRVTPRKHQFENPF